MNEELAKAEEEQLPLRDRIKGMYFPVLDHGFVALVDSMGGDLDVERAARVSYGAGTRKISETRGVLRYLMRHKHTTPFEMVELKFHVKLPIFVARQLIRHRTASVNEYSMRYSLAPMQFYNPLPENLGSQSKKNKQGRGEPISDMAAKVFDLNTRRLQQEAAGLYEAMIAEEVDLARELARMHLPLSLYTEWYWKIDLHNALHFLQLRCDKHAQWEIQETARIKAAITKILAPLSFEAWVDYKYQSRTFSRMEMQLLRNLVTSGSGPVQSLNTKVAPPIVEADLGQLGISKREWDELLEAFNPTTSWEPEVFDLDLSSAKTAKYFEEEAAKYVPEVKKRA